MTASGAGLFNVSSLSVGYIYRAGNPVTVNFGGTLSGGGSVTQTFTTPSGNPALQSVSLSGFVGLSSFSVSSSGGNAFQFDNVNAQAVPEAPAALMLGMGVLALLAVRRKA